MEKGVAVARKSDYYLKIVDNMRILRNLSRSITITKEIDPDPSKKIG